MPYPDDGEIGLSIHDRATGEEQDRLELGVSLFPDQPLVADGTIYVRQREGLLEGALYDFDAMDVDFEWSRESAAPRSADPELTVADDTVWYFDRGEDPALVARDASDGPEH